MMALVRWKRVNDNAATLAGGDFNLESRIKAEAANRCELVVSVDLTSEKVISTECYGKV